MCDSMKFISSLAQDISLVPEIGKQTMKYMITGFSERQKDLS